MGYTLNVELGVPGFISRSLSLKIRPLGLKIAIVPERSVDLAALGFIQVSDDASVYIYELCRNLFIYIPDIIKKNTYICAQ